MTYFRELPDVEYLSFLPDRQSSNEYVRAKNLFRRPKLRDDISNPLIVFDKYVIPDGYRPDNVAEELYGSAKYDWVVLISSGITNIRNEWPLSDKDVYRYASKKYGNNLFAIHHYETKEQKDSSGRVVLDGKKIVTNTLQIPYPSYGTEILEEDLFYSYEDEPNGINSDSKTIKGNLFITNIETIQTTENYGTFLVNANSNVIYGGTWTYILNENAIESNQNVKDKISFLSKDGYLKIITINIAVDESKNATLSYNVDSSQQSYITFYDNKTNSIITRTNIIIEVTNYGNEILENNKKREINVLKPRYLQEFIRDTRNIMKYKKSSQLITDENDNKIIRTENVRNYDTYGKTFERPAPSEVIVNVLVP